MIRNDTEWACHTCGDSNQFSDEGITHSMWTVSLCIHDVCYCESSVFLCGSEETQSKSIAKYWKSNREGTTEVVQKKKPYSLMIFIDEYESCDLGQNIWWWIFFKYIK